MFKLPLNNNIWNQIIERHVKIYDHFT
jgi:hypothetical protein